MNAKTKEKGYKRGAATLIVLAVFTGVEYLLGSSAAPAVFLWIIGLIKAGLVLWFFMHIRRVFEPQTGGHE